MGLNIGFTNILDNGTFVYDGFDPATATVTVGVSAEVDSSTTPDPCPHVLWFSAAAGSNADEDKFTLAGLLCSSRTRVFTTFDKTNAEQAADETANGSITIYPLFTGCDISETLHFLNDADDAPGSTHNLYAAVWQDPGEPDSSSWSTMNALTGELEYSLDTPSYIRLNQVGTSISSYSQLYNNYQVPAGTTLFFKCDSSLNFSGNGCPASNDAAINWYVSSADVPLATTNFASCTDGDSSTNFTFAEDGKSYTVWAEGFGPEGSIVDSKTIITGDDPGNYDPNSDNAGYLESTRSLAIDSDTAISVGTKGGRKDRSINLMADYCSDGRGTGSVIAQNATNSRISTRRDTIMDNGQGPAALDNDTFNSTTGTGGLRFSEFRGAQSVSGKITLANETVDQYGYWTQSNGSMKVVVNVNTVKNKNVTVAYSSTAGSGSSTQDVQTNNVFSFGGLNTRNDSGPFSYTITITDTDSGHGVVSETKTFPTASGATSVEFIGNIF